MLDERHIYFARQERELDRAKFIEGPALAAAARCDGFVPHRGHPFAQRFVTNLHQAGEKFRDFVDAVGSLGCCHSGCNLFGNTSRSGPIIAVIDWINPAHWFLAGLLFDDVRHQAGRSRDHENPVEGRGIHS